MARVGLHEWEEPCISYGNGSGTIFFSGCNMACVYCQNHEISSGGKGREISVETLCDEILRLEQMGASNINFVTPTHFSDKIRDALDRIKHRLSIPTVYNTSSYENVDSLKALEGYIDIYLPDIKYYSPEISAKYSYCHDYFPVALKAIDEMLRQTGECRFDNDGHMQKGVLVRHLVLPSHYKDSLEIFENLSEFVDVRKMAVSVMRQYFPTYKSSQFSEINRKTTTLEYMKVVSFVSKRGFARGFMQDKTSAKKEYVPIFDY